MLTARPGFRPLLLIAWLILAGSAPAARGWNSHGEITKAAIDVLPADEPLAGRLGDSLQRLTDYCWNPDFRQALQFGRDKTFGFHGDETYYFDDYLLFPAAPRHYGHISPEVKRTYSPYFRRALQALRTETPVNAARWVGSLLHFVEDSGSPPHASMAYGPWHANMETWVDKQKIVILGYVPQSMGQTDDAAEAALLKRMDAMIEFTRARAERCLADVKAGNRAAVEPVVLESALETARLVADLLHTLGILTRDTSGGGELTGHAALAGGLGTLDQLPAKIVLLGTLYSTLTDEKGHFALSHLPPGAYRMACFGPGGLCDRRDVQIKPGAATEVNIPRPAHPGGLVRNGRFEIEWVSAAGPDDWYAIPAKGKTAAGWQGEWLPLERGRQYTLMIRWKSVHGAVATSPAEPDPFVRVKKAFIQYYLNAVVLPDITRGTEQVNISAPADRASWIQIFISGPGKPGDIIDSIDVMPK